MHNAGVIINRMLCIIRACVYQLIMTPQELGTRNRQRSKQGTKTLESFKSIAHVRAIHSFTMALQSGNAEVE